MTHEEIKTALDFYANPKNYRPQETRGGKHKSKIEIDGGVQARKVLEMIEKISKRKTAEGQHPYTNQALNPMSISYDGTLERLLDDR
jgi:hypothetical protein